MPCEILNQLEAVRLSLVKDGKASEVQIDLKGATVTSWKVDGKELIFVRIPLVFPQFGQVKEPNPASKLPQHGFARILRWNHDTAKLTDTTDNVSAVFTLNEQNLKLQAPELQELWSYSFALTYRVTLSPTTLSTTITVLMPEDNANLPLTPLLHSYFTVDDISQAYVTGLKSKQYIDKVQPSSENPTEASEKLAISSETDRIYLDAVKNNSVALYPGNSAGYHIEFEANNLNDAVIWNPWSDKAIAMADMGDSDYHHFLCVELGQIQSPFQSHDFHYGQTLRYVKD